MLWWKKAKRRTLLDLKHRGREASLPTRESTAKRTKESLALNLQGRGKEKFILGDQAKKTGRALALNPCKREGSQHTEEGTSQVVVESMRLPQRDESIPTCAIPVQHRLLTCLTTQQEHQFNVEELAKTLLDQADRKTASTNDRSMGVEPLAVNNKADNFCPAPPAMSSDEHGLSVLYAAVVRVKATDEAVAVEESNAANELDKARQTPRARFVAPHISTAENGDGGNTQHEEELFISEYSDLEREPLVNRQFAKGKAVSGEHEQEEMARDVPEQGMIADGVFGQSEMTDEDYMPEQEKVMNGEDEQEGIESEDEMSQTVQVLHVSERQPVAKRLRVLHQESQFIRTPNGKRVKPFSDLGRM